MDFDFYDEDIELLELMQAFENMKPAEYPSTFKNDENSVEYWQKHFNELPLSLRVLFKFPYVVQKSEEWKKMRTIVSGSNVGSVLNSHPPEHKLSSSDDLFLLQTNQIPSIPDNAATLNGDIMEPVVAQLFANYYGKRLFQFSSIKWIKIVI